MSRRALIAAAVFLGTAGGAVAVADHRDPESRTSNDIPMEPRTIAAVIDLHPGERARSLYSSLIPLGYEMPSKPQVAVYMGEPNVPTLVEGQPYNEYSRWVEGPVSIKVRNGDEEGYYPLAMPVSSQFEYDLGRAAGLPKILVEGEFTEIENGFATEVRSGDRELVRLEWTRRRATREDPAQELDRVIHFRYPLLTLFPSMKGPQRMRVLFTPNPPPDPSQQPIPPFNEQPAPEFGVVKYKLDPNPLTADETLPDLFGARNATLGDLIPLEGEVPGAYDRKQIVLNIDTATLRGEGRHRPPLQLVAACIRGRRVRADVRDVGAKRGVATGVRRVDFSLGRRVVARDRRAPFVGVLKRRARLSGVAHIAGGGREVLRAKPRCR